MFVSRHNQSINVTSSHITEYCQNQGIAYDDLRTTHTHVIIRECPFCHPTKGKADNMFKLYVQIGGGAYFCHRCGSKGSWFDFKMKMGGYEVVDSAGQSAGPSINSQKQQSQQVGRPRNQNNNNNSSTMVKSDIFNKSAACLPMPSPKLQATYITNLLDNADSDSPSSSALEYLTKERGLKTQTLRKFGVGLGSYKFPSIEPGQHNRFVTADCVTFPWIMKAKEVHEQETLRGGSYNQDKDGDNFVTRRIKARSLKNKGNQRLDPPGGGWGLFGWHTVPDDAKEIVITEGEYDAMAVYQATGRHAVSLPNGCRSLPVEVLPMLERFEKVYLWMDNDAAGREGAEIFAKKIGINRCFLVQPTATSDGKSAPKDANEALLSGFDLDGIMQKSKVVPHDRVVTFADLRSPVIHEILNPEKYVGVPVPSLPKLTDILKGFRRGELTVLTGPTGTGKTTFLGQLSLDFAENDVRTLWGSFEIKNTRLMHKLLQQFARGPLIAEQNQDKAKQLEAIEVLADKFQDLPLYFMKFHGGSNVDDVIDAMEYAVYVNDVQHIMLDNMQFMMSRNTRGFSNFDKFDMQDAALDKFRSFATEHNVHVTLVVHPRKEAEGDRLGISSFYGSAKATQEADNVLILQQDGNRKFIEVKKNRFDGTIGYCPLHFDISSKRYMDNADAIVPPSTNRDPSPSPAGSGPKQSSNQATQITTRFVSSATASNGGHFVSAAAKSGGQNNTGTRKSTWDSILEK